MKNIKYKTCGLLTIFLTLPMAWSQDILPPTLPKKEDSRLELVATSNRVWNGVAVSEKGTIFASLTQTEGPGPQVVMVGKNAKLTPYPDNAWNNWIANDPEHHFYHVNALRFGPDGYLYVVDAGNTGIGTGAHSIEGAAKIVKIDTNTQKVVKIWTVKAPILKPASYLDDIRFNGDYAYISEPGFPGLIVLNMKTDAMHRVLDNHPLVVDNTPLYADGKKLFLRNGNEKHVGVDQLEVSPDGKWLWFQVVPGPMARIETRYLNDAKKSSTQVASHAVKVLDTWTTGGTAIDDKGNIYASDVNTRTIKRIAPNGTVTEVIADPRLVWIDAMWISKGALWMPSAQLNRTPNTTGGKASTVQYPVKLYKLSLPIEPPALDHK